MFVSENVVSLSVTIRSTWLGASDGVNSVVSTVLLDTAELCCPEITIPLHVWHYGTTSVRGQQHATWCLIRVVLTRECSANTAWCRRTSCRTCDV